MDISIAVDMTNMNDGEERDIFASIHAMEHETIYNTILSQGNIINHFPLSDMTDTKEWLENHAQEHVSIADFLNKDIAFDLTNVDFHNKDDTAVWMQAHADIHLQIDQTLGL